MLVKWTENAKQNLLDYKQNSKLITTGKAEIYINSLINYVNNLENFQDLGKFLFNINQFKVRQLIYNKHRIFYAINNNTVYILYVITTSRDLNYVINLVKDYTKWN